MSLSADTRLGPYAILDPLGAGGMGEVYRARDTRLGREVAVKVLPERFADSPEALARFEREARAVAALSHPNILSLFDFGQADGTAYAVTELLKGETLRERLAHERLSDRKAVDIGDVDRRGAVRRARRRHRAPRPQARKRLPDLGRARQDPGFRARPRRIARRHDRRHLRPHDPRPHRARAWSWGPPATSPRSRSAGDRPTRGATSSPWARCSTRCSPASAPSRAPPLRESLAAILRDQPPEVSRSAPGVSPSLDRLVARCLEKNPDERFQSARDLAYALRESESGSRSAAVTVGPPPRRQSARVLAAGAAVRPRGRGGRVAHAAGTAEPGASIRPRDPPDLRAGAQLRPGRSLPTGSGSPTSPMPGGPRTSGSSSSPAARPST